jgi:hypothetical protein
MNAQQIIQTGDTVESKTNDSLRVDKLLSQVSALYLTRFQAYQSGDRKAFQMAEEKIASLKAALNKL